MPEKTKENKELKEKKESVAKKSTKTSNKSSTKKSTSSSAKKTTSSKKVSPKTASTKATTKKATSSSKKSASNKATKTTTKKETPIKKKTEVKLNTVAKNEKKVEKKKEVVKEETIIEKIKSFLAKIVAMQEEARLENEVNREENIDKKSKIDKHTKNSVPEKTTYMLEYYDLPYRYNETVVKILAQTPKKLFVYWDISDDDRQKYLKAFGEKFFEETYPDLLVHNEDKNYTFEVAINDFANSWYLDINDPKSKYIIELGRKFKTKPEIVNIATTEGTADVVLHNDYVPIISSNVLEVPNDRILFESTQGKVLYRNVKDNKETFVNIENSKFAKSMAHIYNIYDLYKEIYKDEIKDENMLDLLNPSSMSSSTFK